MPFPSPLHILYILSLPLKIMNYSSLCCNKLHTINTLYLKIMFITFLKLFSFTPVKVVKKTDLT